MLETENYIDINISKTHRVDEIIKHVITVSAKDTKLNELFKRGLTEETLAKKFKDPSLYELRLLEEDDERGYCFPLYEIAALDRYRPIGDFATDEVGFCRIKEFAQTLSGLSQSTTAVSPTVVEPEATVQKISDLATLNNVSSFLKSNMCRVEDRTECELLY